MSAARVLVVDDEPAVLAFSRTVLTMQGYDVVSASSGEEALRIVANAPAFDLVLSDIVMPGIGGPELLETVHDACPSTALMLMTGYAAAAVPPGIVLLPKPFTPKTLGDAVHDCLAAAQRARADLAGELERSRDLIRETRRIAGELKEMRTRKPRKRPPPV